MRPYPKPDESWGELAVLRGTIWGDLLPIVSGAAITDALHGRVTPLMNEIGPHPHGLLRQIPETENKCALHATCIMYAAKTCHPGKHLVECYRPPNTDGKLLIAASNVMRAWADGRYVIIVEGDEFSVG